VQTKQHPRQMVTDNPEDPIFYSTCLVREIVKEWLPVTDAKEDAESSAAWAFNNNKYCLDCDSYTANHDGDAYNTTVLKTRHWWLQDEGCCSACDKNPPVKCTATTPTAATTTTKDFHAPAAESTFADGTGAFSTTVPITATTITVALALVTAVDELKEEMENKGCANATSANATSSNGANTTAETTPMATTPPASQTTADFRAPSSNVTMGGTDGAGAEGDTNGGPNAAAGTDVCVMLRAKFVAAVTVLEEAKAAVEVANKAAHDAAVENAKTTTTLVSEADAASSDGMGAGAIVGIVFALIVVTGVVGGVVYFVRSRGSDGKAVVASTTQFNDAYERGPGVGNGRFAG